MAPRPKQIAAVPSGHAGVHRARKGGWEALVIWRGILKRLGIYRTSDAAAAARARFWQTHDPDGAAAPRPGRK
jgi:hypothetical protein